MFKFILFILFLVEVAAEESQEVPYSKYKTSTLIQEGFQSFGTPASSIIDTSSTERKSLPKMVCKLYYTHSFIKFVRPLQLG